MEKPSLQPVSEPLSKFGWYWSELSEGWYKTTELVEAEKRAGLQIRVEEAEDTATSSHVGGSNRATIGETTISTAEAATIRKEVQNAMRQAFPGIHFSTGQAQPEVFNFPKSPAPSVPLAIAGSEVSLASTQSNDRTGENQNSLERMMKNIVAVNPA